MFTEPRPADVRGARVACTVVPRRDRLSLRVDVVVEKDRDLLGSVAVYLAWGEDATQRPVVDGEETGSAGQRRGRDYDSLPVVWSAGCASNSATRPPKGSMYRA